MPQELDYSLVNPNNVKMAMVIPKWVVSRLREGKTVAEVESQLLKEMKDLGRTRYQQGAFKDFVWSQAKTEGLI